MANDDNSEDLNLNPRKALDAIGQVIKEAERLNDTLAGGRGMGKDKFAQRLKQLQKSLGDMGTILNGVTSSLTSTDQKVAAAVDKTIASITRTGNEIGLQARNIERAAKLAQDAAKVRLDQGNVKGIKDSTAAAVAYEAQLAKINVLLDKLTLPKNAGAQAKIVRDLETQAKLAGDLLNTQIRLADSEKIAAREASAAAKQAQKDSNDTMRARQAARRADLAEEKAAQREMQRDADLTKRARDSARRYDVLQQTRAVREGRQTVAAANTPQRIQTSYYSTPEGKAQLNFSRAEVATNEIAALTAERAAVTALMDAELKRYGGVNAEARVYQERLDQINARLKEARIEANRPPPKPQVPAVPTSGETLGAKFVRNAGTFANYALIGTAFAGAGAVASEVVKLDVALHNLQGITQATDAGMVGLRKSIIDVASGSRFMASEVADAATILGQAGLSTSQIGESLNAVVTFAQATGIKLEESVNLITSAMGAFNLRADESMSIANLFTAALNNSKLTVDQLSQGFQYSASAAAQTGISYTELATTMALMAQAGIKSGSMIGTGIRQIINQLSSPSTKLRQILLDLGVSLDDVDIRSHGLLGVMKTLKAAGFDAGEAFRAFGTRGASAFIALEGQIGSANSMRDSIVGTNAAMDAAKVQMESFGNTAKRFGSTIAALASQGFQPLLQVLQGVLSYGADFTKWMQNLGPVISVVATAMGVFGAIKGAQYIGSLTGLASSTRLFFLSLTSVEGVLGVVAALLSPMVLTIAAVTAGVVGLTYAWNAYNVAVQANRENLDKANGAFATAHQLSNNLADDTQDLIDKHRDLKSGTPELTSKMKELSERYKDLGLDITQLNGNYDELLNKMRQLRGVALMKETNALIDAQGKNVAVLKDEQTTTDQAQFNLVRRPGFNLDRSLLSQYGSSGLNIPAVGSALNRFGRLGAARPTAADIPSLYAAAASADAQNQSGLTSNQKDLLKELHDAILKLAKAADAESSRKGQIAFQGSAVQALKLRSSSTLSQFQTTFQDTQQAIKDSKPIEDGIDPVEYAKAINQWVNDSRARVQKLYDATVSFGKVDQSHKLAISDVQQDIKGLQAYLSTTDSAAVRGAKTLREQIAGVQQKAMERALEAAKGDLSNATNEKDLKAAYGKIQSYTSQLFSIEADKEAAKLGLRSTDYTTTGGKLTITAGRVPKSTRVEVDAFNTENPYSQQTVQNMYEAKRRSLMHGFDNGAKAGDRLVDSSAITTLNMEIANYIKDVAYQFKSLDKYTPTGVVRDHAAKARQDIEDWYGKQIDLIAATLDKKIKALPDKDPNKDAQIDAMRDEANKAVGELDEQRAEKIDTIDNNVKDLLNNNVDRLPANMGEAWDNVKSAVADPRKTKYAYSEWATTFQDTMIAVVDNVKQNFGSMWESIMDGSKSAGEAFSEFGRGILATMLRVVSDRLAKQFLELLMGGDSGGSSGGILGSIFKSVIGAFAGSAGGDGGANAGYGMDELHNGGLVRRAQGGSVSIVKGNIPTRDSVPMSVRNGSFILRQSATSKLSRFARGGRVNVLAQPGEALFDPGAVAAIGLDNLKAMNSGFLHRAAGGIVDSRGGMHADTLGGRLHGTAAKLNNNKTPHQTNVWVVKPDEQPPMGKNDVLAVVTNDMLSNGQTKKMIKSIMAGA